MTTTSTVRMSSPDAERDLTPPDDHDSWCLWHIGGTCNCTLEDE